MVERTSATNKDFRYFVYGRNPELLVHTGTHGDEWEVVNLVKHALIKYQKKLPAFIFVPEVSPSAVRLKTRENSEGLDLNRAFFSETDSSEVLENMKILEGEHFKLMVAFHEDLEVSQYYIYDACRLHRNSEAILRHIGKVRSGGIELFTGIDNPEDEALGYQFINGYRKFLLDGTEDNGMITMWAINHGITEDCIVPEIPGKLPKTQKKFVVESFFEEVLIKTL